MIEANKSTETICGIAAREIAGRPFSGCPVRCSRSCHEILRRTVETKMPVREYRIECDHQDRLKQVVSVSSSPLLDPGNHFMGRPGIRI